MKTAVSSTGRSVTASNTSPSEALCPKCKGSVVLRVRKLMANGGNAYYWQHRNGKHTCYRWKPFLHMRPKIARRENLANSA